MLAGEHLRSWLDVLPDSIGDVLFEGFRALHNYNPFAVMRFWFDPIFGNPIVAVDRAIRIEHIALHEKRGGKSGHFVQEK